MRRILCLCSLFAWFLTLGTASAQSPAQSPAPAYRLGVQDRLRVHVHEWPVLTGEFTVGIDGTLKMPLLGEVYAAGLTTTEVAAAIAERLQSHANTLKAPATVVDIVQYRPFYIVGGVDKPGEYAFRPGLVVLKAVSIAGGFYRAPRTLDWGIERDSITADGEVRIAAERLSELKAREYRLRAEASEATELAPVPKTVESGIRGFLAEESRLFEARRQRHLTQMAAFQKSIALAEQEIASLTSQISSVQEQFVSAKSELTETRQRVATGASNLARILPLERAVAQIARERKELDSAILRTKLQINIFEREIQDLVALRKSVAISDLQTLTLLMKESEEKMATAKRVVEGARDEPRLKSDLVGPDDVQVRYFLVREINGVSEEIEASETTPVQPGSIVKVQRAPPSSVKAYPNALTDGRAPRASVQN